MSDIQALEPKMIERYLRGRELRYLIDQDGRFVIHFYGEDVPDYRFGIAVGGPDADILDIIVAPDDPTPEHYRHQTEAFVAGWNRSKRWPKAYLEDDRRGRGFWITAENSVPLRGGVHSELFDDLLDTAIATGRQLVHDAAKALRDSENLDSWLREAG